MLFLKKYSNINRRFYEGAYFMQRCLSGLRSTIGNRVTGKTGPEVRILFSAPTKNTPFVGVFFVETQGRA